MRTTESINLQISSWRSGKEEIMKKEKAHQSNFNTFHPTHTHPTKRVNEGHKVTT